MRIEFTESVCGANYEYHAGEIHDVPVAQANRYLAAGSAVKAPPEQLPAGMRRSRRGTKTAELAVTPPPETR